MVVSRSDGRGEVELPSPFSFFGFMYVTVSLHLALFHYMIDSPCGPWNRSTQL